MSGENDLVVVWTSGDKEVALNMVFMYTLNSKLNDWWDDVIFVVWGPSTELLTTDSEVQNKFLDLKEAGVKLEACKACADDYGATEDLKSLGVEVKYMGEPLTDYLKGEENVITF